MSEVSNKPLDKQGIIKRLIDEGFTLTKKPDFLPGDEELKDWMASEDCVDKIKAAAKTDRDFLNGCLYTVSLSECAKIPIPKLKKKTGELLLEQSGETALDIVNPDMCDLAQIYFQETNDQELWVKAHAKAQEGFPMVFQSSEDLRKLDKDLNEWKAKHPAKELSDEDKKQLDCFVAGYLQKTIDLMDMFSMIDPIHVTKQIDEYFKKNFKDYIPHLSDKVSEALHAYEDHNANFEYLREKVEEANA